MMVPTTGVPGKRENARDTEFLSRKREKVKEGDGGFSTNFLTS